MDVTKVKAGDQLKLFVEGRIDNTTAPKLNEVITENLDGIKIVVIDCLKLNYISSAGLRVLLATKKQVDDVVLLHPSDVISDVLEMTGFDSILTIK